MSPDKLEDIKIVIQRLRDKSKFVYAGRMHGCCHIVAAICGWDNGPETKPTHEELEDFPGYSGITSFPVKHPYILDPGDAYFAANKWEDDGYGNNRRAYALWLANFLETKFFPNQLY